MWGNQSIPHVEYTLNNDDDYLLGLITRNISVIAFNSSVINVQLGTGTCAILLILCTDAIQQPNACKLLLLLFLYVVYLKCMNNNWSYSRKRVFSMLFLESTKQQECPNS